MEILMPQLGETVAEGKITTWFKAIGDAVKPGDNLFEIETDKVSMEVPATSAGVISEIRVPAGARSGRARDPQHPPARVDAHHVDSLRVVGQAQPRAEGDVQGAPGHHLPHPLPPAAQHPRSESGCHRRVVAAWVAVVNPLDLPQPAVSHRSL